MKANCKPECTHDVDPSTMTMAQHAECWQRDRGRVVPPRGTPEWDSMYFEWHNYAWTDFTTEE